MGRMAGKNANQNCLQGKQNRYSFHLTDSANRSSFTGKLGVNQLVHGLWSAAGDLVEVSTSLWKPATCTIGVRPDLNGAMGI